MHKYLPYLKYCIGLIILTNDGELTNHLTHPKNKVEKVYIAKIKGIITREELGKLCRGLIIDGYKTSKAKAKLLKIDKKKNSSVVELIIHEGKNHQVKKMFHAVGLEVIYLKRMSMGGLKLDEVLKEGEYRPLTADEINYLKGLSND